MLKSSTTPIDLPGTTSSFGTGWLDDTGPALKAQLALAEIGQTSLESANLDAFLKAASAQIAHLFGVDYVAIMECDAAGQLVLRGGAGWSAEQVGTPVGAGDGKASTSVSTALTEPAVDTYLDRLPAGGCIVPSGASGSVSGLTVPIGSSSSLLGVLGVYSKTRRKFDDQSVLVARSAGHLIASAMNAERAAQKARRDSDASLCVREIGRVMSSSLDTDEVYPAFAELVAQLIEFDRISINFVDLIRQTFAPAYVAGLAVDSWPNGTPQSFKGRSVEAAVSTRQGQVVQDENLADFHRTYPLTDTGGSSGLRSMLTVPVTWQGDVIAVLTLRSKKKNAYSTDDLQMAERIAAQIAGSLANSRLHEAQAQHAEEQTTLAELSRIIASSVRLDETYPRFAASMRKLIPFDRIAINTIDEDSGTTVARYVWGTTFAGSGAHAHRPITGTATAAVTSTRSGLIISPENIMSNPARFSYLKAGLDAGLKSTLAVPLIYRNQAIGALMLRSMQENAYSFRDLNLAERVAVQISGAVWNARIHEELERSAHRQTQLARLATSNIEAHEQSQIFEQVFKTLSECIQFNRIVIGIYDRENACLKYEFVRGIEITGKEEGSTVRQALSSISGMWPELLAAHCGPTVREGIDPPEWMADFVDAGMKSWVQVPLKIRERLVGVISLRSVRSDAYSGADLELLERFAAQIAPAVENVRFFEGARGESLERALLDEVVEVVAGQDGVADLVKGFCASVRSSIPADSIALDWLNPALEPIAVEFNMRQPASGLDVPALGKLRELAKAESLRTRRVVFLADTAAEATSSAGDLEAARLMRRIGVKSSLSVPLSFRGSVLGVVHFQSAAAKPVPSGLRSVVGQAGTLVGNAIAARLGFESRAVGTFPGASTRHAVIAVSAESVRRRELGFAIQAADLLLAGEASTLHEAIQIAGRAPVEAVVWEVHEEASENLSAIRLFREAHPDVPVLVVDCDEMSGRMGSALASDASGYVSKKGFAGSVNETVHRIVRGELVVDRSALAGNLRGESGRTVGSSATSVLSSQLTERDVTMLQAVADGKSNAEIAESFNFAVGTIKNRLAQIYKVLGVSDRAAAMAVAIRSGLIQ